MRSAVGVDVSACMDDDRFHFISSVLAVRITGRPDTHVVPEHKNNAVFFLFVCISVVSVRVCMCGKNTQANEQY